MLNNEITINPDEIRKMPDNSIMDIETIRQIGLYSCKTGDNSLNNKIRQGLEFAALYPHMMTAFDIALDFNPELAEKITNAGNANLFAMKRKMVFIRKLHKRNTNG